MRQWAPRRAAQGRTALHARGQQNPRQCACARYKTHSVRLVQYLYAMRLRTLACLSVLAVLGVSLAACGSSNTNTTKTTADQTVVVSAAQLRALDKLYKPTNSLGSSFACPGKNCAKAKAEEQRRLKPWLAKIGSLVDANLAKNTGSEALSRCVQALQWYYARAKEYANDAVALNSNTSDVQDWEASGGVLEEVCAGGKPYRYVASDALNSAVN